MENLNYRVAVVGLDFSKMDEVILSYLPRLFKAMPLERVVFVHVAKELELPEELIEKYPDLIAPVDEGITADIEKKVAPVFKDSSVNFDIVVREGAPTEEFLRVAKIKNADLIIMGRKKDLEGSGLISGHIVRKCMSSMLFITEDFPEQFDNILVPIDFSKHSSKALQLAYSMAERTDAQLNLANVYRVPLGYYKTGKSYDEFAGIMREHAIKKLDHFCKDLKIDASAHADFILAKDDSISTELYKKAKETKADLVVIGSRGRTKTAALLIGSIVEKFVFQDPDVPVLVVKNKGENMNFFEALLNI